MIETRRGWQLRLKSHLNPVQYRLVSVEEPSPGSFVAEVLHRDSRAVLARIPLTPADPDAAVAALREVLTGARPPQPRDVTIIPHSPGP